MKCFKILLVFLMTLCLNVGAYAEAAEKIAVRVAYVTGPGSVYDICAKKFKELLDKNGGGRFDVKLYPATLTQSDSEGVDMTRAGNLEIMIATSGNLVGFVPETEVLALPFLLEPGEHLEKVLASEVGQSLLDKFSAIDGITALGYSEDGWRNILTKDVVINKLEDLKGVRIRTMDNEINSTMYKALGAVPVPVAYPELFTSLQTGVVAGQDNSFIVSQADGFTEISNAAAMVLHFYASAVILAGDKWYDKLSKADQELIKKTAMEAGAYQRAWFMEQDIALSKEYEKKGWTITYPTDMDKWRAAVQPVYEAAYKKNPSWRELVEKINSMR